MSFSFPLPMHIYTFMQFMKSGSKCTYFFVNCFLNLRLCWKHSSVLLSTLVPPDFLMVPSYGCIIIDLTDSIIGHVVSSRFLTIINNVMIDKLECKSYKAVFNTLLFYMYGKSCPKYPHFVMFLLCSLTYFFLYFTSKILHHDHETFYTFRLFVKFSFTL